jgi:diguanylate cyclase (GGDEF)-like protein
LNTRLRKHYPQWLAAAIVAGIVVLAGTRLLVLGANERAGRLRQAAATAAAAHARRIEAELRTLFEHARAEALRAGRNSGQGFVDPPLLSVAPHPHSFWLAPAGEMLRTGDVDPSVSDALAGDWALGGTGDRPTASLFGPVRYGSQWFVAAQAALPGHVQAGAAARVVVYGSLDALLLRAQFGHLVDEGYDFELRQDPGTTGQARVFHASHGALDDAMLATIRAPGTPASRAELPYFALAVRPHGGWYPANELATGAGLVAVLAWLLAWITHDLSRGIDRAKASLATAHARLRAAQAQLAKEIAQHVALQKSLEHVRFHDPSTGLPNRRYFMDRVDRALRDMRTRRLDRLAVGLVQIDRFALINDTLGHTAGDELLLHVARRFAKVLARHETMLARWGTDQLALLTYPVPSSDAARALVVDMLQACQEPFALRRHSVRLAAHVGYTCIDSGLQRAEEVLREADVALSVAGRKKGTLSVGYAPGMGGAAMSLIDLEADLHIALNRREFALAFQPIYDLQRHRAVGVETLLRWRHPVQGMLTPDKFLAVAEDAGVTVPITHWVIERACRLAAEWRQRLPQGTGFYVSVNLSATALDDPGLSQHVAQVLEATGMPPQFLKLELTESCLANNPARTREVLEGLHAMGVGLMLDDFGTGASSLGNLQRLPFDYVKIDRPFVALAGSGRPEDAIAAAIVQMAASLGLQCIAEAVESEASAMALAHMGCAYAQGHFYSQPVEAEAAFACLREPARRQLPATVRTGHGGAPAPGT